LAKKLDPVHVIVVTATATAIGFVLKQRYGGDWFEFAGFLTGVVGVYLTAIEHIINWPIGLANVAITGWVCYTSRLFGDLTLQVLFFVLSVMGWISWARGGTGNSERPISRVRKPEVIFGVAGLILGTAIYYPILLQIKDSAPFPDALLTVASIVAQIFVNLKKLENWLLWIPINAGYIPLYAYKNLVSFSVLSAIYLALAISGHFEWRRIYLRNQSSVPT
jgi:nicotinamide mononucleotide transporter